MIVNINDKCGTFAENKDIAREIRENYLKPTLKTTDTIVLDFSGVDSTTQSFVHALISGIIQEDGVNILNRLEFKGCTPAVKSLVATVVNYSMD